MDDIILIMRGESVGLGPLRRDHLQDYLRWINDLQVTRTLGAPRRPMTAELETAWLDGALMSSDPSFTIYELATMRPIGNTTLRVEGDSGCAEFGLMIGEKDVWGRGYGSEVTRLMLGYAFDVLGLYNVMLRVYANNPRAIGIYERAGFRRIGVRRGALKVGRRRVDEILMDAVADEFEPSQLHTTMHPA
jgi:RimJ/RimL family protein N-acetyltransferase